MLLRPTSGNGGLQAETIPQVDEFSPITAIFHFQGVNNYQFFIISNLFCQTTSEMIGLFRNSS